MWKTRDFPSPPGSSPDGSSASSAGASFSIGPGVGSDNSVGKPQGPKGWVPAAWDLDSPPEIAPETVRADTLPVVDNAAMPALQRSETTIGPVAHEGRTITLVARTTAMHLGDDGRGALGVYARPAHVEVLEEDGRRHIVRVPDIERALLTAIALATAASIYVLRLRRSTGRTTGRGTKGSRR